MGSNQAEHAVRAIIRRSWNVVCRLAPRKSNSMREVLAEALGSGAPGLS